NWLLDQVEGELGQQFTAKDPLSFVDSKPYPQRMSEAQDKTGESEALLVMYGKLRNLDIVTCAFDFRFMGGSMGSVVGDRFVEAAEKARSEEHTSELQSRFDLVCRLLLERKKIKWLTVYTR